MLLLSDNGDGFIFVPDSSFAVGLLSFVCAHDAIPDGESLMWREDEDIMRERYKFMMVEKHATIFLRRDQDLTSLSKKKRLI